MQVVYSGPLEQAAPYFSELGFAPDELRSNIADYMLDLVIRASDADVAAMVHRFAGYAELPRVALFVAACNALQSSLTNVSTYAMYCPGALSEGMYCYGIWRCDFTPFAFNGTGYPCG